MRMTIPSIDERALPRTGAQLLALTRTPLTNIVRPMADARAVSTGASDLRPCRANWRPGNSTLQPFLDRISATQPPVTNPDAAD